MFQSLFFWKSVLNHKRMECGLETSIVSILVFLEVGFKHWLATRHQKISQLKVSILVFLEVGFKRDYERQVMVGDYGFNPCFFGSRF